MNKKYFTLIVFSCLLNCSFAQNVGIGTNTPSAKLEIASSNSGILIPRLTTIAKNAILNPPKGLLVYDSTAKQFYYHDGTGWKTMSSSSSSLWQLNGAAGNEIKNTYAGGFWSAAATGLDVNADNATNPVTAPVNGAGTRLMWIPSRSAFRAGTVSDVSGNGSKYWDKDSIGLFSFATGFNTIASDYPDHAEAVAEAILAGKAAKGIIICGSGVGVSVAANKFKGIRAGVCHDNYSAHQSVEHDNANVLCLGERIIGTALMAEICITFLNAIFSNEERHIKRLEKIKLIEERNFR